MILLNSSIDSVRSVSMILDSTLVMIFLLTRTSSSTGMAVLANSNLSSDVREPVDSFSTQTATKYIKLYVVTSLFLKTSSTTVTATEGIFNSRSFMIEDIYHV